MVGPSRSISAAHSSARSRARQICNRRLRAVLIRRSCARSTGLCTRPQRRDIATCPAPATSRRRRCHSPKAPAAPQPHTQRPPAGARLAAGLSLDRTGNGRPNQTRDLVPFLKQKYREAKVAGVKAGRSSTASPTNTSACNLPPRGRAPHRSESCRFGN
jgi:hypothetical protein